MSAQQRQQVTTIVLSATAARVATVSLMILANTLLPTHDATGVHRFRPDTFPVPAEPGVGGTLAAFTRWDAAWFLSIADSGYPSAQGWHQTDLVGTAVDCSGTRRAWGGEEYEAEHEARGGGEAEGGGGSGAPPFPLDRCHRDVPLEEQAHAFFPFYPWCVRWAATALRALLLATGRAIDKAESLVLAAMLVSNSCFVIAAVLLYRLGALVTGDTLLAFRGALAFCATPASVFFSTAYTESLYAALSFSGLLFLFAERNTRRRAGCSGDESGNHGWVGNTRRGGGTVNSWVAASFLSLATLTRSNGIAGAGVLVLEKLRWMAGEVDAFTRDATSRRSTRTAQSPPGSTSGKENTEGTGGGGRSGGGDAIGQRRGSLWNALPWARLVACAIATALQALLILAPYVLVQAYAYRKFCGGAGSSPSSPVVAGSVGWEDAVKGGGEHLGQLLHPWCTWRVPSLYAHVQSAYWGVGTLRYYQWKQIPNFLLAAPTLALTACGTVRFFSAQLKASHWSRVGEPEAGGFCASRRSALCPVWLRRLLEAFLGTPRLPHPSSQPFERSGAAALVLQWAFLGALSALCMNVQVATRFLAAACPPLHWWTASLLVRAGEGDDERKAAGSGAVGKSLRWYLGLYFVVGSVLHANFLPWT